MGTYSVSVGNTQDMSSALFTYFSHGDSSEANNKRVATTIDGYTVPWWTRSCLAYQPEPFVQRYEAIAVVEWGAGWHGFGATIQYYVRPAMALPSSLYVSDDGYVTTNQPPTAPGSIEYGTPRAAKPLDLIITPVTDPN